MYLHDIIEHKKKEIQSLQLFSYERKKDLLNPLEFLKTKPFIAEIKKASPSLGTINSEVDIIKQAQIYESHNAGAISVLTDKKYFKGDLTFLHEVSHNVNIPLLCKDFIISDIQIENAYRAGADMILLIVAVLSEKELEALSKKAESLNLIVLYEIHAIDEFEKIKNLNLKMVGINSRNLKTFEIDKVRAAQYMNELKKYDGDFLKVSESGIENTDDIKLFKEHGADAFLIGTALMRSPDPGEQLKQFYSVL